MSSVYHDSTSTITNAVKAALSEQPVLRRISAAKQTSFALDLALIALGCRCAWLVDVAVVADPEQIYDSLLRTLRQKDTIFDGVSHLFEPASEQSFFVNREQCQASADGVSFVQLSRNPQLLACPPPDVLAALQTVRCNPPTLPPGLEPYTAIPLAGVLLGYSVAYVPDADGAFLAQASLDVFACTIHAPTWEYPFLKFSCPVVLAAAHPELTPAGIIASLKTRFEPRLQELGLGLFVKHSTEVVDRVAL
ncbi:hypothetical protein C8R45DRAFT_452697 [Mycena sanguinolenta]|nr:hypothetical protein C8R45DRAFT_452697 [Mycena sanguinolenta]